MTKIETKIEGMDLKWLFKTWLCSEFCQTVEEAGAEI